MEFPCTLSTESVQGNSMKVNKEIIITSKREIDINILAIIFDILDELDLNNQLEGIKELTDYILSRKKRKNKLK